MKSKFSTSEKQAAIAGIIKRSVERLNNDPKANADAERFGECRVAIVIKELYGKRLGDFHGSYTNGGFKVNIREQDHDNYDAVVTITEDAFMSLCTGKMTPEYAHGVGGIRVTGESAYKLMVVGIAVGDLIYNVLKR